MSQTLLITNVLYYLAKNPDVRSKLLVELRTKLMSLVPKGSLLEQDETWYDLLTQENLD